MGSLEGDVLFKLGVTVIYLGIRCCWTCSFARLLESTVHLSVHLNYLSATFTASYLTSPLRPLLYKIPQVPIESTPHNPRSEQIFEELLWLRFENDKNREGKKTLSSSESESITYMQRGTLQFDSLQLAEWAFIPIHAFWQSVQPLDARTVHLFAWENNLFIWRQFG